MSTEKKLTAVEYLESKIFGEEVFSLSKAFEKAKELEKQQIIDAGETALQTDFYVNYESVENYYKQTFKNE